MKNIICAISILCFVFNANAQEQLGQLDSSQVILAAECNDGSFGSAGYRTGAQTETQLLNSLWRQFGSCEVTELVVDTSSGTSKGWAGGLDSFLGAVEVDIVSAVDSSYVRCRNQGRINSLLRYMDEVTRDCTFVCAQAGIDQGQKLASAYCATVRSSPSSLKRIKGVMLCTVATQESCRVAFAGTVSDQCPEYMDIQAYESTMDQACPKLQ